MNKKLLIPVALLLLIGGSAFAKGGPSGPTGPGKKPGKTPGKKPSKIPPSNIPTPGGPQQKWGTGEIPDGFDLDGNGLWIAPDCDLVVEGSLFEPMSRGVKTISAISEPTLAETLMAAPDNSVYGFVSYLMDFQSYEITEVIALEVMAQANPLCADLPEGQRPAALQEWLTSFTERIREYVEESTIGFG